jgi:hypothetical protein
MKSLSKDDDKVFTKTIIRDAWLVLGIVIVTALGVGLTLYAVAKGIID